jgi:NTE family protein
MKKLNFRTKKEDRHFLNFEMGLQNKGVTMPTGIIAGQKLDFLLKSFSPLDDVGSFDEFPIPYRCVATDIETGEPVILDSGNLSECMRASMAVAGAFTPVMMNGEVLVDGGLVAK